MRRLAALYGLALALGFIGTAALVQSCYATTGPVPTCAQDPLQPQCPAPIHDERARDAGR